MKREIKFYFRSIKKTNSAKSTTSAASNTSNSSNKRKQAHISSAKSIAITSDTFDLDCFLQNIVNNKYKRILVLTGAGISTASGIPDFRTPGTGIYDNLSKYCVPYPEAIFERAYFHRNPRPFFKIAKEIMPNFDKYRPNKIHFFLRLLQEKKLLLRLYTQNIDNLETVAGIKSEKLIEAHGSFRSATCIKCQEEYPGSFVEVFALYFFKFHVEFKLFFFIYIQRMLFKMIKYHCVKIVMELLNQ